MQHTERKTYQTKNSKVQNGQTNSISLDSFKAFHNFNKKYKENPLGHEAHHVHTVKQMPFIY